MFLSVRSSQRQSFLSAPLFLWQNPPERLRLLLLRPPWLRRRHSPSCGCGARPALRDTCRGCSSLARRTRERFTTSTLSIIGVEGENLSTPTPDATRHRKVPPACAVPGENQPFEYLNSGSSRFSGARAPYPHPEVESLCSYQQAKFWLPYLLRHYTICSV